MGAVPLTPALRDSLRQRSLAMDGNFTGAGTPSADLYIETPTNSSALLGLDYPLRISAFSHLNGGFIQNVTLDGAVDSFVADHQLEMAVLNFQKSDDP